MSSIKYLLTLIGFLVIHFTFAQDRVELGKGIKYYGFQPTTLSHKYETIKADGPFMVSIKGKPDLELYLEFDVESGKEPISFTRETRNGVYEMHVVPQSAGTFWMTVTCMSRNEVGPDDDEYDLFDYEVMSSKGSSAGSYFSTLKVKPTDAFYKYGLTDADLVQKKFAIKAQDFTADLELKHKHTKLDIYPMEDEIGNSIDANTMVNGCSQANFIKYTSGWMKVSFYGDIDAGKYDDEHELVSYMVYFPKGLTADQYIKKEYYKYEVSTTEDIKIDEVYDYSIIDDWVKNIPDEENQTMGQIANYINKKAKNDRERIRGAFKWCRNNITYSLNKPINPDGVVLGERKTKCSGYSNVFDGFMYLFDIDCRVLSGIVFGGADAATPEKPGNHAWNAVACDGKWYLVDVTWGIYFVDPHDFIFDHLPSNSYNGFQLLKYPLTKKEFLDQDYSKLYKGTETNLSQGMVNYYKFDRTLAGSKSAASSSKKFQYTTDRFGNAGKAINLNGTSDRFKLNPENLDDFSISMWLKVDRESNKEMPILNIVNDAGETVFSINVDDEMDTYLAFINEMDGEEYDFEMFGNMLEPNHWLHFVVTKEGNKVTVWSNLINYDEVLLEVSVGPTNYNFNIGFDKGRYFKGAIDDLMIYNRALSREEIGKLFYKGGYIGKWGDH